MKKFHKAFAIFSLVGFAMVNPDICVAQTEEANNGYEEEILPIFFNNNELGSGNNIYTWTNSFGEEYKLVGNTMLYPYKNEETRQLHFRLEMASTNRYEYAHICNTTAKRRISAVKIESLDPSEDKYNVVSSNSPFEVDGAMATDSYSGLSCHTATMKNYTSGWVSTGCEGGDDAAYVMIVPVGKNLNFYVLKITVRYTPDGSQVGVEDMNTDETSEEEWFSIGGIRLASEPSAHGLYLRKQSGKVSKVQIR